MDLNESIKNYRFHTNIDKLKRSQKINKPPHELHNMSVMIPHPQFTAA